MKIIKFPEPKKTEVVEDEQARMTDDMCYGIRDMKPGEECYVSPSVMYATVDRRLWLECDRTISKEKDKWDIMIVKRSEDGKKYIVDIKGCRAWSWTMPYMEEPNEGDIPVASLIK